MESFIEMNNHIILMSGILSVTLLLTTITAEFPTLATPNAFGQQVMFGNIDKGTSGSASDTTSNNNMTEYNIVPISTTTATNDRSVPPFSNVNQTAPMI